MVVLQIFCDKGAERKARDEERRASKRRMTSTGAKKRLDDLYHVATERSEFYTMANRDKPPVSVACATLVKASKNPVAINKRKFAQGLRFLGENEKYPCIP